MNQLTLVDIMPGAPEPLQFSELTPRQLRAIRHFCAKGFTVQLSRLPNIKFVNQSNGDVETHKLPELVAEYDHDRREDARARASERRLQKAKEKNQ